MANPHDNPGRPVALLFPGQGAQQVLMGAGLYGHVPVFTEVMDSAFALWGDEGARIRGHWLSGGAPELLDDGRRSQPLLYAIDYALGRTVLNWGVRPAALLGHSVGELAAAALAGVFDFEDGARLILERIRHLADTPDGGMLAVAASVEDVGPYLSEGVAVGAVNAPRQLLLAGLDRPLADTARRLRADGFTCRRARARQAFHSPAMAEATARSAHVWRGLDLRCPDPGTTVFSAYLGGPLPDSVARNPDFWASQPADPVYFGPTLQRMLRERDYLLVEAGPGRGLGALALRRPEAAAGRTAVTGLLPAKSGDAAADRAALRDAAARIAAEGHAIDRGAVPRPPGAPGSTPTEATLGGRHP
ncbi:acyltransferase domain-containing protein [Nocardiopsis coralliicola]